ncbi:MAG: carboxypeptidase-like regulatory domain-containing protein [Planctomycetota bacterium]|nr:carboxypeptidase-like regulatory domain-containing protein [Planctomycetota bacterium]
MRRRWGAPAVWAFALSVAVLALWVLAPEDVWRRTCSEEGDPRSPHPDAQVAAAPDAAGEQVGDPNSAAPTPRNSPVAFAVVTIEGDSASLRRDDSEILSGHVRFNDGIPVAGVTVACELVGASAGTRTPFDQHQTNARGYFALLVRPGETYTVQARCGKAWVSVEQRAEAGRRDLDFVVPRTRRLWVALIDAQTERQHRVGKVTVRWRQDGEQAQWIGRPNTAVVVLPGPAEVDEGQDVVVEVFDASGSRSGKTFRLARNELDRGPLLRVLRYEPALATLNPWIPDWKVVRRTVVNVGSGRSVWEED